MRAALKPSPCRGRWFRRNRMSCLFIFPYWKDIVSFGRQRFPLPCHPERSAAQSKDLSLRSRILAKDSSTGSECQVMGCLGCLTVMLCIRLERTANGRPYSANPSAPCFRQTSPRRAEGGLRGKRGFRPKDRIGGAPIVPQNDLRSLGFGAAAPIPVPMAP